MTKLDQAIDALRAEASRRHALGEYNADSRSINMLLDAALAIAEAQRGAQDLLDLRGDVRELDRRLEAVEADAHKPYDFSGLVQRVERIEVQQSGQGIGIQLGTRS